MTQLRLLRCFAREYCEHLELPFFAHPPAGSALPEALPLPLAIQR